MEIDGANSEQMTLEDIEQNLQKNPQTMDVKVVLQMFGVMMKEFKDVKT